MLYFDRALLKQDPMYGTSATHNLSSYRPAFTHDFRPKKKARDSCTFIACNSFECNAFYDVIACLENQEGKTAGHALTVTTPRGIATEPPFRFPSILCTIDN